MFSPRPSAISVDSEDGVLMADDNPAIVAQAEAAGETLANVKSEIGKAVFGQERVI